jgi:hypothetical protein
MFIRDVIYRNEIIFTGYSESFNIVSNNYDSVEDYPGLIEGYPIGEILVELLNYNFTEFSNKLSDLAVLCEELEKTYGIEKIIDVFNKIAKITEDSEKFIENSPLIKICGLEDDVSIELEDVFANYKSDFWNMDEFSNPKWSIYDLDRFIKNNMQIVKDKEFLFDFQKNAEQIKSFLQLRVDIENIKKIYTRIIDEYIFNNKNEKRPEGFFDKAIIHFNEDFIKENPPPNKWRKKKYYEDIKNEFFMQRTFITLNRVSDEGNLEEFITFESLGDFIYHGFFKSFNHGNIIKRCKNCGKFFLNTKKYEIEYCGNVADEKSNRTCREIGAD